MDVTRVSQANPVAYPRSAIDEFLAGAKQEQARLEEAIADAQARARRARAAADESQATARLLRSTLHDLRQEFADTRRRVEAEAEALVAAARDEAATILAQARLELGPPVRVPEPEPAVAPDASASPLGPSLDPFAPTAGETPAHDAGLVPHLVSGNGAVSPTPVPSNGATATPPAPLATSSTPLVTPTPAPVVADAAPRDVTGDGPPPPVTANDDQPHAVASGPLTIDLSDPTATPSRGLSLGSFLRRGRPREPEPEVEPSPDAYLDFLRGALLDDRPLDDSADPPDSSLRWRWTP